MPGTWGSRTWRSPGVVSSSRAPGDATQLRVPAPFKSADQSSDRRVLPLNYRTTERCRPDSNQHSTVFVRTRSVWQSAAILKLERESEIDRGCLCHVGPPRQVVPGGGLEPPPLPRLQAERQFQLALVTRGGPQFRLVQGAQPSRHCARGRSWGCRLASGVSRTGSRTPRLRPAGR